MSADSSLQASLSEDRTTVTLRFPEVGVSVTLDLGMVEEVLKNLGDFRQYMSPEVARTQGTWQTVTAIPDPIWTAEQDVMQNLPMLNLRDPRFGWLHYHLPRHEAQKMGDALRALAVPPDAQQSGKPN